ncbi:MAG TPA: B-box zinc finger protein [Candidatus Acidoferrum sp.]|nr:B-box zinc finger protein [Candidatus Acidoferrum sp.]
MNCAVHADTEASGYCRNCGKAMCAACSHRVRDVLYCEDCLAQHVGLPAAPSPGAVSGMPADPGVFAPPIPAAQKQNGAPVVAFLLGFIPGLGAVYNGEYNKAIIHVVVFGALILGIASDLGEGIQGFLIFALVIAPFYMAIDAMRTAKAKATGQPLADPFENWSGQRPLGPIILIGIGGLFLLNNFGFFEFFRVRQIFVPLLLIGVGFFMLKNRMSGKS